ncbi:MAG: hypothetical protein AVDCRST_MAG54-1523 [uncultured Actinomycetospora sp.]|uniref:Uncharacterized protein n=1 Tax=uncultured Actinomycetospora sp. TaxID=1135996 RepID=A0A6J4I673_9PSEU|nr:MAG: hypothetical protein AVDCRST_MAG54-1523 [uncultured Actinomycetospora sp.]
MAEQRRPAAGEQGLVGAHPPRPAPCQHDPRRCSRHRRTCAGDVCNRLGTTGPGDARTVTTTMSDRRWTT